MFDIRILRVRTCYTKEQSQKLFRCCHVKRCIRIIMEKQQKYAPLTAIVFQTPISTGDSQKR